MVVGFDLETLADPEDVPVGVAHVHLAQVPGHVGRRTGDFETLLQAAAVDGCDVIDKDAHPRSVLAPAALTVLTEKDLVAPGGDGAEVGRIAPIPRLAPPELLEPREALLDVGDVEDGRDVDGAHGGQAAPPRAVGRPMRRAVA